MTACSSSSSNNNNLQEASQGIGLTPSSRSDLMSVNWNQDAVRENSDPVVFELRLQQQPQSDIELSLTIVDESGADFGFAEQQQMRTMTIEPHNWRVFHAFKILSLADNDDDHGEAAVEIRVLQSSDSNFPTGLLLANIRLLQSDAQSTPLHIADVDVGLEQDFHVKLDALARAAFPQDAEASSDVLLTFTEPEGITFDMAQWQNIYGQDAGSVDGARVELLLGQLSDLPLEARELPFKSTTAPVGAEINFELQYRTSSESIASRVTETRATITTSQTSLELSLSVDTLGAVEENEAVILHLQFTRSNPLLSPIEIALALTDANQEDASDRFYAAPEQVTLEAGESTHTLKLYVADQEVAAEALTVEIRASVVPQHQDKAVMDALSQSLSVRLAAQNEGFETSNTFSMRLLEPSIHEGDSTQLLISLAGSVDLATEYELSVERGEYLVDTEKFDEFHLSGDLTGSIRPGSEARIDITAILDDQEEEGDESLTFSLATPSIWAGVDASFQTLTLDIKNMKMPRLYFKATGATNDGILAEEGITVYEGQTTLTLAVALSRALTSDTPFELAISGDAEEEDFSITLNGETAVLNEQSISGVVPAESTEIPLLLDISQDGLAESAELLTLELVSSNPDQVQVGTGSDTLTARIAESDQPRASIAASASVLNEGDQTTVEVTLDRKTDIDVKYRIEVVGSKTTLGSTEWQLSKSNGTIAANSQSDDSITLTIQTDTEYEAEAESLVLRLIIETENIQIADGELTLQVNPDPARHKIGFNKASLAVFEDAGSLSTDSVAIVIADILKSLPTEGIKLTLSQSCQSGCPNTNDLSLTSTLTLNAASMATGIQVMDDSRWETEQRFLITVAVHSDSAHVAEVVSDNEAFLHPTLELTINGPNDIPALDWSLLTTDAATVIDADSLEVDASQDKKISLSMSWSGGTTVPFADGVNVDVSIGDNTTLNAQYYTLDANSLSFNQGERSKNFGFKLSPSAPVEQKLELLFKVGSSQVASILVRIQDIYNTLFDGIGITSSLVQLGKDSNDGGGKLISMVLDSTPDTLDGDQFKLRYSPSSASQPSFLDAYEVNLITQSADKQTLKTLLPSHLVRPQGQFTIERLRSSETNAYTSAAQSISLPNNHSDNDLILRWYQDGTLYLGNHVAMDGGANTILAASPGSGHLLTGTRSQSDNTYDFALTSGAAKENIAVSISANGTFEAKLSAIQKDDEDSATTDDPWHYHLSATSSDAQCSAISGTYNTNVVADGGDDRGESGSIFLKVTNAGVVFVGLDNPVHQLIRYDLCAASDPATLVNLKTLSTDSMGGPIDIIGMDVASENGTLWMSLRGKFKTSLSPDSKTEQNCLMSIEEGSLDKDAVTLGGGFFRCIDLIQASDSNAAVQNGSAYGQLSVADDGNTLAVSARAGAEGSLARLSRDTSTVADIYIYQGSDGTLSEEIYDSWFRYQQPSNKPRNEQNDLLQGYVKTVESYGADYRNYFGYSVELSGDGKVLAVSGRKDRLNKPFLHYSGDSGYESSLASNELRGTAGNNYGGVSVYVSVNNSWYLVSEIAPKNGHIHNNMLFGSGSSHESRRYHQLALSEQGDVLVVGSSQFTLNPGGTDAKENIGSIYVY